MHNPNADYFKFPSLPWMINILGWFWYGTYFTVFAPHLIPVRWLGPAGTWITLTHTYYPFFGKFVLVSATSAHICEAFYSLYLCKKKGIMGQARVKWFLSTAIFGGASLYELVTFKPQLDVHAD
ncbi:transmembrane protein 254-like [Patiria miniata]|uniref:Transmembrane protein 254 n=1 Tax=Patiria miniata TaxID=46514 RepID=A0A913ZHQ2_PATMI|nr:transmembrane protein 254-like [Patiria miniata]